MNISKYLSNKITHMSVVFSIWIIFIHYSSSCDMYDNTFFVHFADYIGQGITRNAVPLFFFISGVLAFWKVNSVEKLIQGAKKRLITVGVCYILWNTIATIFFCGLSIIKGTFTEKIDCRFILDCLLLHKYNGPLWYLLFLLIYSICAPFVYQIIKRKIFFIILVPVFCIINLSGKSSILAWFLFYLIGAGIALHYKEILNKPLQKKYMVMVIICFIILQLYRIAIFNPFLSYVAARKTLVYKLYELISPLLLWFSVDFIRFDKIKIFQFEKFTFFVYAIHYMIVAIVCSESFRNVLGGGISE